MYSFRFIQKKQHYHIPFKYLYENWKGRNNSRSCFNRCLLSGNIKTEASTTEDILPGLEYSESYSRIVHCRPRTAVGIELKQEDENSTHDDDDQSCMCLSHLIWFLTS